jgi:integrase
MARRGTAYWAWSQEEWSETLESAGNNCTASLTAVAYLLGDLDGRRAIGHVLSPRALARKVFGPAAVDRALRRLREVHEGWGYSTEETSLGAVEVVACQSFLVGRSPRLEDLSRETVEPLLEINRGVPQRAAVSRLTRVLGGLGVVDVPIERNKTMMPWSMQEDDGSVPRAWLGWCKRWAEHSTLRGRHHMYRLLLKIGRWLGARHPEASDPARWDATLAAAWVAEVDGMVVGDWSSPGYARSHSGRFGKPIRPNSKAGLLNAARTFFRDLQQWGWIETRFNPDRCLRTPRSIGSLIGPDPRVIDAPVWAKLVKAAFEIEPGDFKKKNGMHYPFAANRALAALWVCTGLRSNEIVRLRVGCIRWQQQDVEVPGDGGVLEKGSVCFLDVPANKTATAFTKPVPPIVGKLVEAWEGERSADQTPMLDHTTNETVHFLFSHRNRRASTRYVNAVLLPALCARAGVPESDSRGRISSHRARATIASQLYNAPKPWTLAELQAYLGHSSPASTRYYAAVDLTRLAKKYAESGYLERNAAMVEVLLDVEALAEGDETALYYELGHGLCANPYWHKCHYRMACVKCPMYVPGEGAQYVRAKEGVRRMLETIPLNEDERRAAEGDEEALKGIVEKKAEIPMPKVRGAQGARIIPLSKKPWVDPPSDPTNPADPPADNDGTEGR